MIFIDLEYYVSFQWEYYDFYWIMFITVQWEFLQYMDICFNYVFMRAMIFIFYFVELYYEPNVLFL